MDIYLFMKLAGITTFTFLILTSIFGFFKFKIKNRFLIHKILALTTLLLGTLHFILFIYLNYFK